MQMKLNKMVGLMAGLMVSNAALAVPALYKELANDIAAVSAKKNLNWAEPMGLVGFDIAASVTATSIESGAVFEEIADAELMGGNFYTTTVNVMKGLPGGFDIGAQLSKAIDGDFDAQGVELRYAILDGTFATPALGLSLSYDRASVGDYDYKGYGVDLTLSKGFANVTPYVGVGRLEGDVEFEGAKMDVKLNKLFAGVNINLLFADLLVAVNQLEDNTSYSVKLGFTF
jgi:hypothetical protein